MPSPLSSHGTPSRSRSVVRDERCGGLDVAEPSQRGRDELGDGRAERGDADWGGRRGLRSEVLGPLDEVEHVGGEVAQCDAVGRRVQAATGAVEQRDAEVALKLGEVLRDGRRGVAESGGRAGDRAQFAHVDEGAQADEIEHRKQRLCRPVEIRTVPCERVGRHSGT